MNILNVFVNLECNMRCPYCFIKHHKTSLNINKLYEYKVYNEYNIDKIVVLGGEPTLLHQEELCNVLDFIYENICKNITIATNGFLLKNHSYIMKHNVLKHTKHPKDFKFDSNVSNQVVLHNSNIKEWYDFIKENKSIKFFVSTDINSDIVCNPLNIQFIELENVIHYHSRNLYKNIELFKYVTINRPKNVCLLHKTCYKNLEIFDYV